MSEEAKKPEEALEKIKKDAEGQYRTLNDWLCPRCGFEKKTFATHSVYCPKCGMRMRPVSYYG